MKIEFFEWDEVKERRNTVKHGVSFELATEAFADDHRMIIPDLLHSQEEKRFVCIGKVGDEVMTVRFTPRGDKIRIIGAAYWRKGRKLYERRHKDNVKS